MMLAVITGYLEVVEYLLVNHSRNNYHTNPASTTITNNTERLSSSSNSNNGSSSCVDLFIKDKDNKTVFNYWKDHKKKFKSNGQKIGTINKILAKYQQYDMYDMNSSIHNHEGVSVPSSTVNENSTVGSYHQHQVPIEGHPNSVEIDDGSGDTAVTNVYSNHDVNQHHQLHHPQQQLINNNCYENHESNSINQNSISSNINNSSYCSQLYYYNGIPTITDPFIIEYIQQFATR